MIIDATFANHLARPTVYPRWLVWFRVKNTSGALEQSGIWNDIGDLSITLSGQNRMYSGGGSLIEIPNFEYSKGFNIQTQTITLSMLTAEIVALIRGYDTRFGEVEIHLALLDSETSQIAATTQAFKGWIDAVEVNENMDSASASINLVSSVRSGTRTIATKQSDGSQRLRDELDAGRKYADVTSSVKVSWGAYSDQVPKFKVGKGSPSNAPSFDGLE